MDISSAIQARKKKTNKHKTGLRDLKAALLFTVKYLESLFISKDLNSPRHLLGEMRKEIPVCERDSVDSKRSSICVCVIASSSASNFYYYLIFYYNTYLSALSPFNEEDLTILSFTNKTVYLLALSLQFI